MCIRDSNGRALFSTFLIIVGVVLLLVGFAGCVLPVLPGPPIGYLALLCLSWARDWEAFSGLFLVVMALLAIGVTVLDFVVPAAGAKRYGASRSGVWGSVAGLLVGMVFFPPLGFLIGALLGALGGELLAGKQGGAALRAAWGVFVGTVAGVVLKLGANAIFAVYFTVELFGGSG